MSAEYRVLVVEDSAADAFLIVRELQRGELTVTFERVEKAAAVRAALENEPWDFIICDCVLPGFDGIAVLDLYRQMGLEIPFIMVSGKMGEEHGVEMLKAGAHDYVLKDNLARLVPAVNRELRAANERRIRKHAQDTQAFLAAVVESCDDAIIGTTMDGTILTWNAGAERLYGFTASEMIGRSALVLIPPGRQEEFHENLRKLSRGEHVENFETVRTRKNGSAIEVSLTISPVRDERGRITGTSTIAHDITKQKRDESDRLALIQDLTTALEAKTACTSQ